LPPSTARYRFEFRLFDWAETTSRDLTGSRRAFFVGFRDEGSVRRMYFAQSGTPFDGDRKAKLAETHGRWFLYSPYDDAGTGYLEWLDLPQSAVEIWLKRTLEATDFLDVRSTSARDGWPENWRVIVG
jgi:hypothetical protein